MDGCEVGALTLFLGFGFAAGLNFKLVRARRVCV